MDSRFLNYYKYYIWESITFLNFASITKIRIYANECRMFDKRVNSVENRNFPKIR